MKLCMSTMMGGGGGGGGEALLHSSARHGDGDWLEGTMLSDAHLLALSRPNSPSCTRPLQSGAMMSSAYHRSFPLLCCRV